MEQKTPEENPHTTQNEREKTRGSATHSHSHRNKRKERPVIPEPVSKQLAQLRQQYEDAGLTSKWEKGTRRYTLYPDEYYETELELLCGDMDPEQAVDTLRALGLYNRAILQRLDTVRAYQYLRSFDVYGRSGIRLGVPEGTTYAERVIAENPGTSIALEARFYIAGAPMQTRPERIDAYKEILEIDPNSTEALRALGSIFFRDDNPVEALRYYQEANRLDPNKSLFYLGETYEKLGDVKTAWVYHKKALAQGDAPLDSHGLKQTWLIKRHIEQIEAGDPVYKPVAQAPPPVPTEEHIDENSVKPHGLQEQTHHAKVLPDDPSWTEPTDASLPDARDDNDERKRAAAKAAQQAHEEFLRHQELSQKELDDFLQWAESIMNADSPMDTNNFLRKEMEAHLKGGQAQFEPDRIVRAFETMERYGQVDGMKRLQKVDPDLAKQVQHLLAEKRTPHDNKQQNRR